jgi:hypothetical protein
MAPVPLNPNPYVVSHPVNDANPGLTAVNKGMERNNYQHSLVNVSKNAVAVGGASSKSKMKKSKKMRMSKRMSKMSSRRRFSRCFRKSLSKSRLSSRKSFLGRRRNKNKNKMFIRGGAAAPAGAPAGATMTIPSFSQTTKGGTTIINQLATKHAQGLAYSQYDGDVKLPPAASGGSVPSTTVSK